MDRKLKIGDWVHYVWPDEDRVTGRRRWDGGDSLHIPALVTRVRGGKPDLTLFPPCLEPVASSRVSPIEQDETTKKDYTWHWPEES